MNYRTIVLAAFVNVLGLISVGDGSGILGLGLLSPLLPVAQITGHAGLLAHGLTGAALLKLKAAAALSGLFVLSGRGIELNLGSKGWGQKEESHGWGHHEESHGWGAPVESHGWSGGSSGHHVESSHGWGSGSGGHHVEASPGWGWESARKKRSTEAAPAAAVAKQYDPSLDEVLAFDQLGCGMRLVCELSATPFSSLGEDEKLILELFGRDGKAPMPGKASKGKLSYSYASILGSNAKDGASTCGRVYGQCPYNRVQIMQSLREAQV